MNRNVKEEKKLPLTTRVKFGSTIIITKTPRKNINESRQSTCVEQASREEQKSNSYKGLTPSNSRNEARKLNFASNSTKNNMFNEATKPRNSKVIITNAKQLENMLKSNKKSNLKLSFKGKGGFTERNTKQSVINILPDITKGKICK